MGLDTEMNYTGHFTEAEWKQIEEHKYYLSQRAGYDVGMEFAIRHWLEHCAAEWRKHRLKEELHEQREEILKHKWIESEKAGTDLGQQAVIDWIARYGADWRRRREEPEDNQRG